MLKKISKSAIYVFVMWSLCLCWKGGISFAAELPFEVSWRKAADDLNIAVVTLHSAPFVSSEVTLVRTSLSRFRLGVIRAREYGKDRATVKELCQLSKAALCVNANFFDENGNPLGLVVSRGILHHRIHQGGKTLTGVLEVTRNTVRIVHRSDANPELALEAVQAGPRLVKSSNPVSSLRDTKSSSRRSGICLDKNKQVVIFVVSSGFFGMSIEQTQQLLLHPSVGCKDALNLDGGGSSQLFLSEDLPGKDPRHTSIYSEGSDQVPVALGLFVRS